MAFMSKAKWIVTLVVAMGLVIGCSERTKNYDVDPFVKKVHKEVVVERKNPHGKLPTNPEGGKRSDVIEKLSIEEHEQRSFKNSIRPIIPGNSIGGISFDTTLNQGLNILSRAEPYPGADPYEKIYPEGVWVNWGVTERSGKKAQTVRAFEGYRGAIIVVDFNDLHIGDNIKEVIGDSEAIKEYLKKLYTHFYDSNIEDCFASESCAVNESDDDKSFSLFMGNKDSAKTMIFVDAKGAVTQVYMFRHDQEIPYKAFENMKKPIVVGKGVAGIDFEMTYEQASSILDEPTYVANGVSNYSEAIAVGWGKNEKEGKKAQFIRVMSGYETPIFIPGMGKIKIGEDISKSLGTEEAAQEMARRFYQHYVDSKETDCLAVGKCVFEKVKEEGGDYYRVEIEGYAYILVDEELTNIFMMVLVTPTPETHHEAEKIAINRSRPIIFGKGAAAIDFDMTFEQASKILSTPTQVDESGVTHYNEGIQVSWGKQEDQGRKAQYIRILPGYAGGFVMPGIGSIKIGQDISKMFTTPDQFMASISAFYNSLVGDAGGGDCFLKKLCTLETGDFGNGEQYYIIGLKGYGYIFMPTQLNMIFQVSIFSQNPEVDYALEKKIADNKRKPIIFGVGAAGMTMDSTMEEANELITYIKMEGSYAVYSEGVRIVWNLKSKPQKFIITDKYKGDVTVKGYPTFTFGEELLWLGSKEKISEFAKSFYQFNIQPDVADYDCFQTKECDLDDEQGGGISVSIGNQGYLFFSKDMKRLIQIQFFIPGSELMKAEIKEMRKRVEGNSKQPIDFKVGVAGITFDMTFEQAHKILGPVVAEYSGVLYYEEGIGVKWGIDEESGRKAQAFKIHNGYKGALEFEGYGKVRIGDNLAEYLTDSQKLQKLSNDFYRYLSGAPEGFQCGPNRKCAAQKPPSGGLYIIFPEYGYFGFGPKGELKEISFNSPNLEPVEEEKK